jgi:DMSO/TMAO reductase YedYZ molybdopterin-dependent catalytic subunit
MGSYSRRAAIRAGGVIAGAAGVAVAAKMAAHYGLIPPDGGGLYEPGKSLTYGVQRVLTRGAMAREFPRSAISSTPFANGSPLKDDAYANLKAGRFADWRLEVDGMVARPGSFSLEELRRLPARSQITQLTCEEGWSYVAEWTGAPLADVLRSVETKAGAKFVVYHSHEPWWWDSVDMEDAMHPQTLVTYAINGSDLPPGHGGPLRLRVPRQLGYKSVEYITRLTVTDDLSKFGKGLGSGAPEAGYSWYAGM